VGLLVSDVRLTIPAIRTRKITHDPRLKVRDACPRSFYAPTSPRAIAESGARRGITRRPARRTICAAAGTFRRLLEANVNLKGFSLARIFGDEFYAVVCADNVAAAVSALDDRVAAT
jgi:hypothetical protein